MTMTTTCGALLDLMIDLHPGPDGVAWARAHADELISVLPSGYAAWVLWHAPAGRLSEAQAP